MSYEDIFAELKYLSEDRDALLKERDALLARVSKSADGHATLKSVLDFCESPERQTAGMRYMRSRDDIVTELRRRISALEGQNVSSFNAEVTAGCRAKSEYSGTPESGFDSRLVHHASSTPAESVTHPDATTEWKSPHSPSDCQVTCPVHLRWADEVEAYMGPGYIRTQAERAAEKICAKLFAEIFSPAGKGGLSTSTEAEIAVIIESEFTTPCPDCEQARATNDTPGFYLDNCEKHRDPASPITVPSEMTKEEMQHEANFLKLQEMLSDGTISRLEYERGLEQNDAEFRATLPAPTAQGDTTPAEENKMDNWGAGFSIDGLGLHRVSAPAAEEEAEVPQFTLERLDMLERQFKEMAHGSLIAEMCRALRATALSATTADQKDSERAWPTRDTLNRLADAADHLLHHHNCDCDGYEEIMAARDSAREIVALPVSAPLSVSEQAQPDTPISQSAEPEMNCEHCGKDIVAHHHRNLKCPTGETIYRASTASCNEILKSFDARDWARAFVKLVTAKPEIATDEGTMIGWFANALMRGYDEYRWRQESRSLSPERVDREDQKLS